MQGTNSMTMNPPDDDGWRVGDVPLSSRFLLGTAGYPSPQVLGEAIAASGTQIVTVGLKRQLAVGGVICFVVLRPPATRHQPARPLSSPAAS